MKLSVALLATLLGATVASHADAAPPAADGEAGAAETEAIRERLAAYLDAFNGGDAEAVGAFWADDAVSVDEDTGERVTGREAVVAGFRAFFEASPGARLTGDVREVRLLSPDVAIAEGTVTLFKPDAVPTPSAYTAVLVREDGEWLIESSYERALPSPTPEAALEKLAWLVGDWRDQTDGAEVDTTVRWSPNRAFLVRSFRAEYDDGQTLQGTQVIGWDPRAKQYRTWTFNSDGSFGEGVASRSGEQWLLRTSHTQSDGSVSSETQALELVDDDTMRVERLGVSVDGVPAPAGEPVTVVRVGASDAAPATEEPTP